MSYKPNPKQYFNSLEEIYKLRLNSFVSLASKHIYNKDHSIDVVHDAMARAQKYFNEHPEKKVREQIIRWLILKECKKKNKRESAEIPMGLNPFDSRRAHEESERED